MPVFKLNEETSTVMGGEPTQKTWYASDTLTTASTSTNVYLMPTGIRYVVASATPSAGVTGCIEYTLSSLDQINSNTANWRAWDNGVVNAYSDITFNPPTALRLVMVGGAGTIKMEIKAG